MTRSTGRRRRLSPTQRAALWEQWRRGLTFEAIAAALAVSESGVATEIRARGGCAPAVRRHPRQLQEHERALLMQWAVGTPHGIPMREAARRLGRAPSTISREIRRNGERTATTRGYDAALADRRAWRRARRPKPCRLARDATLCARVASGLRADWSPAQVSAWLRMTAPDDPTQWVSAETIYRSLYVQTRGVLNQELSTHLRRGRSLRRSQARTGLAHHAVIMDGVSIAARPAEVEARAVPGHWEGDLVAGGHHSFILTLVERASRFVVLTRLGATKQSTHVVDALIATVQRLPQGVMTSLTWDRGSELAQHRRFSIATDVQVYFCDPRSPWQRGSNENTNGLLRQYFPKGMNLSGVSQETLDEVANKLNTRPRQTLGWANPATALSRLMRGVALTG